MEFLIIAAIAIAVVIIVAAAANAGESASRRAGRRGETIGTKTIKSVLRDGDMLFTNVEIAYEDKPAELDNVIVNSFGVFIIEVKNYTGMLVGGENDYEWKKYKTTDAGNTYEKTVKNPIKQVKRQVYVLAKVLEQLGLDVWVEGYALLIQGNSPVRSAYVLSSISDIDKAIHTPGRSRLSQQQVESIAQCFQPNRQ